MTIQIAIESLILGVGIAALMFASFIAGRTYAEWKREAVFMKAALRVMWDRFSGGSSAQEAEDRLLADIDGEEAPQAAVESLGTEAEQGDEEPETERQDASPALQIGFDPFSGD